MLTQKKRAIPAEDSCRIVLQRRSVRGDGAEAATNSITGDAEQA